MRAYRIQLGLAVLFGVLLRGYHYARDPVIWQDEAAIVTNVLEKDALALLGPLRYHQAAPPLFLWLEKAASEWLGDSPRALRLPPFLASVAALLLFVPIARKLLAPSAAVWAVLLFASSESLYRHACEVKPYAFDVLAATIVIALYVHRERIRLPALLVLFALLAPLLQWLSYPASFLHGGLLVALLPSVWRDRRPRTLAAYGFLIAMVAFAFAALLLGPAGSQKQDAALAHYWTIYYPDWSRPWTVPYWTVQSSLHVGLYACKPTGQLVMLLAIAGALQLWKDGRRGTVAVLGVPIGLALVAALLHRYPYGGFRLMVFATPAVLLFAAAALPALFARLQSRSGWLAVGAVAILLIPAGNAIRFVVQPWQFADNRAAAEYVLSHRRADDPVIGNDWTHAYYFRGIGASFVEVVPGMSFPAGRRAWVVWSEKSPAETRLLRTQTLLPPGWRALDRFDSLDTTAVLYGAGE